jgi:hypothetical protein
MYLSGNLGELSVQQHLHRSMMLALFSSSTNRFVTIRV